MAGKDVKKPAAPAKAAPAKPAPVAAAPRRPTDSSFDLGLGVKGLPPRKAGPPERKSGGLANARPFDTLDGEVTNPLGARLTGSTTPNLKPVKEKMLTPFTSAQPALVRPPTIYQKQRQHSGFDDDEKTNTEALFGNVTGPALDADEEPEITATSLLHDGLLPAREVTSVDTWKAVNAPMTSRPGRRSAVLYQNVIDQFACGYNQRYQVEDPTKPKTHIFVWDVTRAMNCEVPHFAGGREQTMGQMVDWLRFEGHTRGWKKANAEQAVAAADRGEAVLALPQDGKLRLLAVVRPGGADETGNPRVAAGIDEIGNDMEAAEALKTTLITYYVHE